MAYDVPRSFSSLVASNSLRDDFDSYEALQDETNFVLGTRARGETAIHSHRSADNSHLTSDSSPIHLFTNNNMWSSSSGSLWSELLTPATSSWVSTSGTYEVPPMVQSARLPPKVDWKHASPNTMTPFTSECSLTRPNNQTIVSGMQLNQHDATLKLDAHDELDRLPRTPASSRFPMTDWVPSTSRERADQPRLHFTPLGTTTHDRRGNLDRAAEVDVSPKSSPPGARLARSISIATTDSNVDERSLASQPISVHYTISHPELAGVKSNVWSERHHAHSLRRALRDPNADWVEAYAGALAALSALNPEQYQMPFGTRVVNIKTDISRNILLSTRCGKYAVMEKVSQRIMKAWEARENPSEKVLFLFSVNGGKKYIGIAEMSGPWDPDMVIEGWETHADSQKCVGGIPVTWIYAKDVAYHQFSHIRQPNNGNPVGNMWNGMNFSSDIGRIVIETYVQSPSTSSILGFPKNYPENAHLIQEHGAGPSRPSRSSHSNRSNPRSHVPPPITVRNIKRSNRAIHHVVHDNGSPTPTARMTLKHDDLTPPPKFMLSTAAQSMCTASSRTRDDNKLSMIDCTDLQGLSGDQVDVSSTARANADAVHRAHSPTPNFVPEHELPGTQMYIEKADDDPRLRRSDSRLLRTSIGYQESNLRDDFVPKGVMLQHMIPHKIMHGNGKRLSVAEEASGWHDNARLLHSCSLPQFPHHDISQPAAQPQNLVTTKPSIQNSVSSVKPRNAQSEHTPTHRPGPVAGLRDATLPAYAFLSPPATKYTPSIRQREAQLKSELHALISAKFAVDGRLEDKLREPLRQDLVIKRNHLVAQYRELARELSSLGFTDMDNLSISTPARHGSSESSMAVTGSSVEAFNVSPVYAADGRVLRSASKHRTSPPSNDLPLAPSRHGHAFTPSFDFRLLSSVDKLVASSDDGNLHKTDLQTAHPKNLQWSFDGEFRPCVDSGFGPIGSGLKRGSVHLLGK